MFFYVFFWDCFFIVLPRLPCELSGHLWLTTGAREIRQILWLWMNSSMIAYGKKKRQKKNGGWTVQQNHFPNPNKKDGQPKKMLNWMFPKSWGYAQFSSKSWIRPFDLYSIDMYRLTTMLLLDPNHCRSVGLPEIIPISVMNIPFMCIFLLVGGFNHLEKW